MVCGVLAKYSSTLMLHTIATSVIIKSSVPTYAIYSVPISSVLDRVEKSWRFFTDTRPLLGGYFSLLHCYIFYPNPLCLSPGAMLGSKK